MNFRCQRVRKVQGHFCLDTGVTKLRNRSEVGNCPLNTGALSKGLIGLSPQEWCECLNRKVFLALIEAIIGDLVANKQEQMTLRNHDCDLASRVAGFHIAESLRYIG